MSGIFETIEEVEQELEKEKTATESVEVKPEETSENKNDDIFKVIEEASKENEDKPEEAPIESIVNPEDIEGSEDK